MSELNSKILAKKAHLVLKELGYEVSLGHAYELLSKLAGYKSWNVASKSEEFVPKVQKLVEPYQAEQPATPKENDKNTFKVFLNAEAQVEKGYYIQAKDEAEARQIMQQYLDYQSGELTDSDTDELKEGVVLHDQVKKLIEQERDYSEFNYHNWVVYDGAKYVAVAEVYNA